MTTLPTLEILHDNRQELLLAEVGALIHNIGKLSEEFLKYQADENGYKDYDYQAIAGIVSQMLPNTLTPQEHGRLKSAINANNESRTNGLLSAQQKNWLQDRALNLPAPLDDHTYALGDFIEFQKLRWYQPTKGGSPPRITLLFPSGSRASDLLEASHNAASGVEKEGTPKDEGKQTGFPPYTATAFGLESPMKPGDFKAWRDELLDALQRERRRAFQLAYLGEAVGDTRRPINEVRLSDLSFSVAGLFKSALAQTILSKNWTPRDDLHWRLLRVNFDVLGLYAKAVKIADLLASQRAVEEACERVKQLVEEEYPLGNEVYRDTTGLYFTFPDLPLPDELEQEIRRRVEDVEPELAPRIAVTEGKANATAQEQLKGILGKARQEAQNDLAQPFDARNLSPRWQQEWETLGAGKWEVCPVCRLRPKRESDEVCEHCDGRRQSRLQTWRDNPEQTIWLTEIADHNDCVALLTGKFGLDDWLSGDLVQTMLVKAAENAPTACAPKNPSPARLRRVWETCQRFWSETVQNILDEYSYGKRTKDPALHPLRHGRYVLTPDQRNGWKENFAYNGTVESRDITLLWQKESGNFLTIGNLQLAGELKQGQTVRVSLTDTPPRKYVEFTVKDVRPVAGEFAHYRPHLTLPASPDQFLAFVPAADALAIVQEICKQYKEQFGKVRNRLPLSLGLVFFERKMPLMAVMDAARQMLGQPVNSEPWTVNSVDGNGRVEFGNDITWNVPTVMGDGSTPDEWYPYFQLDGAPAAHHTHQFQHNSKTWVHVKNLQKDDKVCLTPSTFDFLWLDAASRRFEIHYEADGRRPARPSRPFYLEDLQRLEDLWNNHFRRLKRSQFSQMLQTIETARERWEVPIGEQASKDGVFEQFVTDTLANANWPKDHSWKGKGIASPPAAAHNDMQAELITAAVRGELADWAELHLEILKETMEGDSR